MSLEGLEADLGIAVLGKLWSPGTSAASLVTPCCPLSVLHLCELVIKG